MTTRNDGFGRLRGWVPEEYPRMARILKEAAAGGVSVANWNSSELDQLQMEFAALDSRLTDRVGAIDSLLDVKETPVDPGPVRKTRRTEEDDSSAPTRRSHRTAVLTRRDSMLSLDDSTDGESGTRMREKIPPVRIPRDISQMSLRRDDDFTISRSGSQLSLSTQQEARRRKKNKLLKKVHGRRPAYVDPDDDFVDDMTSESETERRRRRQGRRQGGKEMEKVQPHYKFWHDLDPYFQPITDDLLRMLHPLDDDPSSAEYQVPPASRQHFSDQWHDDDRQAVESKKGHRKRKGQPAESPYKPPTTDTPGEGDEPAYDSHNVAQRILAALVEEKLAMPHQVTGGSRRAVDDSGDEAGASKSAFGAQVSSSLPLQDRIMAELRSIGLFGVDEEPDLTQREDDEICARLRLFQSQLHEVRKQNNFARKRLLGIVTNTMMLQDRQAKLRASDKSVIDAYKRRRVILKGASKGKKVTEKGLADARVVLDRRHDLLSANAAARGMPGIQPLHYTTYVASGQRSAYDRYLRQRTQTRAPAPTIKLPSARSLATLPQSQARPQASEPSSSVRVGSIGPATLSFSISPGSRQDASILRSPSGVSAGPGGRIQVKQ